MASIMFNTQINNLYQIWQESLIGGAVIVVCALVGWLAGNVHDRWAVRVVKWWLDHIVYRVVISRSWLKRTVMIAVNNSLICLCPPLLGKLDYIAWLAIACIGFCLGVALRLMIKETPAVRDDEEKIISSNTKSPIIGMLLNLLEIPAIMLCAGLGLSQGAMTSTIDLPSALHIYCLFALPMFIIGASGESLWMGCDPNISKLWTHKHK